MKFVAIDDGLICGGMCAVIIDKLRSKISKKKIDLASDDGGEEEKWRR